MILGNCLRKVNRLLSAKCIDALEKKRKVLQETGGVLKKRGRVFKEVVLGRRTRGGPLLKKWGGGVLHSSQKLL